MTPSDMSIQQKKEVVDYFLAGCKMMLSMGANRGAFIGVLEAYLTVLMRDPHPLEYYIERGSYDVDPATTAN